MTAMYACMRPLARVMLRSGITRILLEVAKSAFVHEAMLERDAKGRKYKFVPCRSANWTVSKGSPSGFRGHTQIDGRAQKERLTTPVRRPECFICGVYRPAIP